MIRVYVCCLLIPLCLGQQFNFSTWVRTTEYGDVEGEIIPNVWNGNEQGTRVSVESYMAVPFAADTGGNNRFRRPVEPASWIPNVRSAKKRGLRCPQGGSNTSNSEDCLHLNIVVPRDMPVPEGGFPVMVWFYGGAFTSGENNLYAGHFLATHGIVTVAANYRVGHFGFAFTDTDACRGNMGLWDQRQALQFVKKNIANFDGNPNKVTISGQSAGAASVGHLMISPLTSTEDLFHGAFMVSGCETNFWSINWPEQQPENYIWQVAEQLSCTEGGDDELMMECLRSKPWEDIRDARIQCTHGHFCQGMAPVIDGPGGGLLTKKPEDLRADGIFSQIPTMIGNTESDGSLYTIALVPESLVQGPNGGFTHEELRKYVGERLLRIWSRGWDNVTASNGLEALMYNYSPWPYLEYKYENRQALNKMITDTAFGMPAERFRKEQSPYAPTYGYVYGFRAKAFWPPIPWWLGVPHAGDLHMIFGNILTPYNEEVMEDSGLGLGMVLLDMINGFEDEDIKQTYYWQTMITNFVKEGNPTPEPVLDPVGAYTDWRLWTVDDPVILRVYNTSLDLEKNWRVEDHAFLREYVNYIVRDHDMPLGTPEYGSEPLYSDWADNIPFSYDKLFTVKPEK